MKNYYIIAGWLFLFVLVTQEAQAQASFSSMYVGAGAQVHIKYTDVTFGDNVMTDRSETPGIVSLESDEIEVSGTVDGFVRIYSNAGTLVFPVADGAGPSEVELNDIAAGEEPVTVSYSGTSGGNTGTLGEGLESVSDAGHWTISGDNTAKPQFSWNGDTFEGQDIGTLVIAVWNGTSWEPVESAVADGSTDSAGSIAATENIDFSEVTLFALAFRNSDCSITTVWSAGLWSNGQPISYDYAATIQDNYDSANGEITACSLTIEEGDVIVRNGDVFTIKGAVSVGEGTSLTFENNAHLMQEGTTNTNAGTVEIHRNSSELFRQDYTMWSSPVDGQGLRDFSAETLYNRFYTYNPVANYFVSMFASEQASDGVNFGTGQGYLIRMPNGASEAGYVQGTTSIIYDGTFTGTPNNGTIAKTVTPASPGVLGYNATGNPYPSPISIPAFFAANSGNTDGTIYLWRKKNGSDIASAYCTLNSVGEYVDNGQLETENPNGFIQTGQGFIVKSLTGTVNFNNTMRSATTAHDGSFFRMNNNTPPADEAHRIWLNLLKENAPVAQMLVGYRSNATMGIDMGIDAPFINDVETGLNSIHDDKAYAIQGRALPFDNQDVVPLQFKTEVAGSYSIAIDHVDGLFLGNQDIFLKDNLLGVTHNIKASDYTFTSDTGVFNTRFEVVYVTNALGNNEPVLDANTIIIYKQERNIIINSGTAVMANVKIFDPRGRLVYERENINASETVISDLSAEEQMLIVQVTTVEGGKVSKKVIY